ncbi:anion permease [Staphylococcus aureus]|uniref:anion permease n=1 Tax=Staphylococcus aureus TaxID=1280 RepID=UPI0037D9BC33
MLKETGGWKRLVWLSVLVLMGEELKKVGFIGWLSKWIGRSVDGLRWGIVVVILILLYLY